MRLRTHGDIETDKEEKPTVGDRYNDKIAREIWIGYDLEDRQKSSGTRSEG